MFIPWQSLSSSLSYLLIGDSRTLGPTHTSRDGTLSPCSANFFLIPQELIDLIFVELGPDELRNSSLVCRQWRLLTIHILFSKISLSSITSSAFLEFLRLKCGGRIGRSLQSLSLTTGSDFVHSSISDTALEDLSTLLWPSHLKLTIYNNTGSKRVDGFFWWARQRKDLSGFQKNFKMITRLELIMYTDTFAEVAEMISSFPVLEDLTINGIWWPVDAEDESDDDLTIEEQFEWELPGRDISLPRTLRTLRVPAVHSSAIFCTWLCSLETLPPTTTVVLGGMSMSSMSSLNLISLYLQKLGEALQDLSMSGLIAESVKRGELDLSCNTNLRKLSLHNPWTQSSEAAFRVLSMIPSQLLEELEFTSWDPRGDLRDQSYWPRLDALLSMPQFSRLRKIILNVNPATRHAAEACLPIMSSRGIVQFRDSTVTY